MTIAEKKIVLLAGWAVLVGMIVTLTILVIAWIGLV